MTLSIQDVKKIANLARLDLPTDEASLQATANQLNGILKFVDQLNEVDTSDTQPMTSTAKISLPRRADVVTDGGYAADLTANAPESTSNFFVVPKVIE